MTLIGYGLADRTEAGFYWLPKAGGIEGRRMATYYYSKTAGIVKVTVGGVGSSLKPGSYAIAAYGAAGGGTSAGASYPGGAGAAIVGGFTLQQGEVLEIVAGGMGGYGKYAGGGGGGSFVLADVNASGQLTPGSYRLLLAGGGGGGGSFNGVDPPFTTGAGSSGGAGSAVAGDGSGGAGGAFASDSGGGGSGYKGGGGAGDAGGGSNRNGGVAYSGGTGAGFYGASGGFGGGGGGTGAVGFGGYSYAGGGGGGGYTGGAGGTFDGGGGGGSIDRGTFIGAVAGANAGAGKVVFIPVCFATGTRIRLWHDDAAADVAVEDLQVGDLVVTASGELRTIRWLGHRVTDCRRAPETTRPIRVAAHAFGDGRPARDLFLSPGHPVLVGADESGSGGHLVPIMCLVNGTTIERVAVESVTYWHIELDEHDILLAEGLPAESYIDFGSRPWFEGVDGALYDPDMAAPGMPGRCRRVAIDGPVVEAERRRLDAVFAMRLASATAWPTAEAVRLSLF